MYPAYRVHGILLVCLFVSCVGMAATPNNDHRPVTRQAVSMSTPNGSDPVQRHIIEEYDRIPLAFEVNHG